MRRFKSKKKETLNKIIIIFLLFICVFTTSSIYFFNKIIINLDEKIIIDYVLNTEEKNIYLEKLNSPSFLLSYVLNIDFSEDRIKTVPVIKENEATSDKVVYIFNTHPGEEYTYESFEAFNINPSVITSSYILSEYLDDEGISSYVETENVHDILKNNDMTYSESYAASKMILDKLNKEDYDYYIDIHRDSASHEISTTTINGKSCARVMFVVGLDHENYAAPLELANKVNDEIISSYPSLTRGVLKKSGSGVNGIYNQDFHPNSLLIEVGGQYNSIEEVNCTLAYLAEVLRKVFNGGE